MPNSAMDALLTTRYGDWKRPIAAPDTFQSSLPFVASDDKSGKEFRFPFMTAISQGATTDNTGGIVALKGARSGKNTQAVLDGVNLYMQEQLSYSDLMKMSNGASPSGNAAAYMDGPDWIYYSMLLGLQHHSEMMCLYGAGTGATIGTEIGVINNPAVATGSSTVYNAGTPPVVVLTSASWAKLLWLNSGSGGDADKGMLVDIYQSNGTTLRANNIRCVGVTDSSKCQVSLAATTASGTFPGTTVGAGATVTAGDRIVPAGWLGASALGTSGILQLVGTFAGIDNTQVAQWKPLNYDCGNTAITFDMFVNFASRLRSNGFKKGVFDVWCSPAVQATLTNGLNPLQKWENNAGQDEKVVGANSVSVIHAGMKFNFMSYGYIKQGEIQIIAKGECVRIGAEDKREEGINGEGLVLELQGLTGTEIRAMAQFAPLFTMPFYSGRMYNFTCNAWENAAA